MWLASSLAAGVFLLVSASAAQPRTDTAAYKMMAHVTSNNELQQMSAASLTRARRDGFYEENDGGAAEYVLHASACTAPDNGSQVTLSDGGCAVADFSVIPANVRQFGAKGDCVNDDGSAFAAALRLGIPVYGPMATI
jgi:hypothetical protein